jgi:hypothetical protein
MVGIALFCSADYSLDQNTVALWNFNETSGTTAYDASGNDLDGQLMGDASWCSGAWGSGICLSGSGGGVKVTNNSLLNIGRFIIQAKIYPTSYEGWFNNIVVKEPPGTGPAGYILRFENNGILAGWIRQAGGSWESVKSPYPLPLNQWYNVKFTKDSAYMRLYVNSDLIDERYTVSNPIQQSYDMGIGFDASYQSGGGRYFIGKIDGIKFSTYWDKFNEEYFTVDERTVALWRFNNYGSEESVIDVSGNGHHGTIQGARWTNALYGLGLEFNGDNDHVIIADHPDFELDNDWTVEALIFAYTIEAPPYNGVIFSRNVGYHSDYTISTSRDGISGTFQMETYVEDNQDADYWHRTNTDLLVPVKWLVIKAVKKGNMYLHYINDSLLSAETITMTPAHGPGNLFIGSWFAGLSSFHGIIDEIRISDTARINEFDLPVSRMIIPFNSDTINNTFPCFNWHPFSCDQKFLIQIDTNPLFIQPLISTIVNDTSFIPYQPLPYTTIYWRISCPSDYLDFLDKDTVTIAMHGAVLPRSTSLISGENSLNVYPNPFRTGVDISVPSSSLSVGRNMNFGIYSICGKKIAEFRSRSTQYAERRTNYFWDGRDSQGNCVAAGIYHIILHTETGSQAIPIIKLK